MGLSKLAEKCKKCRYVDTCDHKEMEAVGVLSLKSSDDAALSANMPVLRESKRVCINGHIETIYVDEIVDAINKELCKGLYLNPLA